MLYQIVFRLVAVYLSHTQLPASTINTRFVSVVSLLTIDVVYECVIHTSFPSSRGGPIL